MSAPADTTRDQVRDDHTRGVYVYGIVQSDVELTPDVRGIGDPPSPVSLTRHGEVAALVSDLELDRPLGRPDDLIAHERLLDATAADVAVLPMRFGAVLTDVDAVVDELLRPHEDEFAFALREFEGRVEYAVKARYVEETLLREVLAENPTAASLASQIRDQPEQASRPMRIQLGEIISNAVEAKRDAETTAVIESLAPLSVSYAVRQPTHEEDAAHVAFLVETSKEGKFRKAVDALAQTWRGRVAVRLLGPLAPYDFVVKSGQAQAA